MSIDWVTVVAQLANFLLLVWLLKKFLYRPILRGIAAREADIAQRMAAADEAKQQALQAEQHYQALAAKNLTEQEEFLQQALDNTKQQREALLAKTRQQLVTEQQEWQRYLQDEKAAFFKRLEQKGAQSLLLVSQKVVQDLADESLDNAIARQLVSKLEPLLAEIEHAAAGHTEVKVSSRFALSADSQALLTNKLQQLISGAQLSFVSGEQFEVGVSVQIGGVQVAWTLASYLDDLSAQLADASQQLAAGGK